MGNSTVNHRSAARRGATRRPGTGRGAVSAATGTSPAARLTPAPLSVVILAAGQGKRMKSELPKVLQPLAGRPLLKHVIETARSLDPAAIHVVYGHGGEQVRAALADEPVRWTLQAERLGTGHALMQAMPDIPDAHRVLVLYGDVPLLRRQTLVALLAGDGGSLNLLTMMAEDPEGYGRIVRVRGGGVRRIVEQHDANKAQLAIRECNSGVLAVPARLLRKWLTLLKADNVQGEYYLTDIIALAVKDRVPVKPVVAAQAIEVLGVNDKAQLAEVEAAWRRTAARELMLAGVTVADPARLDVRGTVTHGADVFLDINVVLEGRVALGDGVRIGPGCLIRNSEIGAGTEVFSHCVIDGAVIGPECSIGPFARFRVNIGAGTIIANYDGANKHRTIIEDDVQTGSNSVLVAPLTVGAGATIGAGSTVTRAVPAGKLTVARTRQKTVEGWQRPTKTGANKSGK
jgi:bifunctional UDP-N-acetylglucosamine pyrophosphorylase/glucosamine-1-phosphate N-acetyltransferase